MVTRSRSLALVAAISFGLAAAASAADHKLVVGIAPFDVASVDGAGYGASQSMAKLVRVDMIKSARLQPELLTPPPGTRTPLPSEEAMKLGQAAKVDVVLVGTVLEASLSSSSRGANTGGLLSGLGVGVGGRIDRQTANVSLHLELVDPATGNIVDSFEVESKGSSTGVGADLSTTLGGFDSGNSTWYDSALGKALREAAGKVTAETLKRAGKLKTRAAQ